MPSGGQTVQASNSRLDRILAGHLAPPGQGVTGGAIQFLYTIHGTGLTRIPTRMHGTSRHVALHAQQLGGSAQMTASLLILLLLGPSPLGHTGASLLISMSGLVLFSTRPNLLVSAPLVVPPLPSA